ncbi:DUF1571 domain-containing protein [Planctomicrobium piriforme]|nr:DUF1571 domain-containing protein [Planctomicrobium piriforme]
MRFLQSRRKFLSRSVAGLTVVGMGLLSARSLLADPTQIAARIEETPTEHVLTPALKAASASLKAMDDVKDYSATFHKKEFVGRKLIATSMSLKLRESPFSVYLKFIDPHGGREVIFIEGKNENNLLVHDTGFASLAGTLSLDPKGSYAMDENRYPVTNIGLRHLVTKVIETWLGDVKEEGITVQQHDGVALDGLTCKTYEVVHRKQHAQSKYQLSRLYVDEATGYPVRVQAYAFSAKREPMGSTGTLVEDYYYSKMVTNIGLTDADFDVKNPKYDF